MSQNSKATMELQNSAAALPQSQGGYSAPPPPGYPDRDGHDGGAASAPVETQSKGDGFWKGCCAALCCCCVLDACF